MLLSTCAISTTWSHQWTCSSHQKVPKSGPNYPQGKTLSFQSSSTVEIKQYMKKSSCWIDFGWYWGAAFLKCAQSYVNFNTKVKRGGDGEHNSNCMWDNFSVHQTRINSVRTQIYQISTKFGNSSIKEQHPFSSFLNV